MSNGVTEMYVGKALDSSFVFRRGQRLMRMRSCFSFPPRCGGKEKEDGLGVGAVSCQSFSPIQASWMESC